MTTPPCTGSADWDLPERGTLTTEQMAAVQAAVDRCDWACTIRAECRAAAVANPPDHRCVQGGLIFDRTKAGGRAGMEPDRWMRLAVGIRPRKATPDGQPCATCGAPMPNDGSGRRYCSARCKEDARQLRRAEGRPGLCRVCEQDPGSTPAERSAHAVQHANAARQDMAAERGRAAAQMLDSGASIADVVARFNVHERTVRRWIASAA